MNGLRAAALVLSLVSIHVAGCCCVPSSNSCGVGGMGSCSTGFCDDGAPKHPGLFDCGCGNQGCNSCNGHILAKFASHKGCQGACGEVYIDEWVNHPPAPDNCGYSCGGCGSCGQCRPLLKTLKAMWGKPYHACCASPFQCGGSCGGDSCGHSSGTLMDGHYPASTGSSCNCGADHGGHLPGNMPPQQPMPAPSFNAPSTAPAAPYEEVAPTPVPEPSPQQPDVTPSSARRLNPAANKRGVRYASARRP